VELLLHRAATPSIILSFLVPRGRLPFPWTPSLDVGFTHYSVIKTHSFGVACIPLGLGCKDLRHAPLGGRGNGIESLSVVVDASPQQRHSLHMERFRYLLPPALLRSSIMPPSSSFLMPVPTLRRQSDVQLLHRSPTLRGFGLQRRIPTSFPQLCLQFLSQSGPRTLSAPLLLGPASPCCNLQNQQRLTLLSALQPGRASPSEGQATV
jgi:hypothetical protein